MTVVEAAAFGAPSCVQRGDSVGCCALLSETGGEFVPADWTDEKNSIDSIANAVEGYLRAGWDGARRGGDGGKTARGVARTEMGTGMDEPEKKRKKRFMLCC